MTGQHTPSCQLSERELEIFNYLSEGLSSKEIADKLYISPRTVEKHREHMLKKTGAKNSVDLLRLINF